MQSFDMVLFFLSYLFHTLSTHNFNKTYTDSSLIFCENAVIIFLTLKYNRKELKVEARSTGDSKCHGNVIVAICGSRYNIVENNLKFIKNIH